jgi:hypothetical protein
VKVDDDDCPTRSRGSGLDITVQLSTSKIVVGAVWDNVGGVYEQASAYVYEP